MTSLPDAYTVSLLHMEGADASTTFSDEASKTWTANGNAQLDTAAKKFNQASALFDGTTDWIDTPDHADFDFGSGDFTVDFWMRVDNFTAGVQKYICGQCNSSLGDNSFYMWLTPVDLGGGFFHYYVTAFVSGTMIGIAVNSLAQSTFNHIALIKKGTGVNLYGNGSRFDDSKDIVGSLTNSSSKLAIGRAGEKTGDTFNGWIDEFRVSKGIARFTTGFTPPSSFTPPVYPYGYFLPQIAIS